ncbi:MAG: hypothetical protein CL583_01865 [Alteromonadaceae bacterium]|nr:hypothetical protein [Alteromonadaceae bacterium]
MSKRPIDPQQFTLGVGVVDIGDVRVARGKTRWQRQVCPHNNMTFDQTERRIWCDDCEDDVDVFDAYCRLVECHESAWKRIERAWTEVKEALDLNLISRAAKAMDKVWRSRRMVPNCPHCGEGLLPEDVLSAKSASSAELTRRKREAKS